MKTSKQYTAFLLTIIFIFGFSSCEKEIDVDLRSVPPHLMIEGIVKQDQLATLRVSHTIDFSNNNGYPNLSGALVTISDDAGNSDVLLQDETGWYTSLNLRGVPGRTYSMSVIYDNVEYTATSKMPPFVQLDSITMYKLDIVDYAFPELHFKDPEGEENQYYRAMFFINGKQHPDIPEIAMTAEFADGNYFHQTLQIFINDSDNDPYKKGDELTIEFQCIDKGAYKFFDTLSFMEQTQTNPISNISNGALGYFSACTSDTKTIIADWED